MLPLFTDTNIDWSLAVGVVSLAVSVGGFWLALRLIRKTRDAARAAERAMLRSFESLIS